MVSSHFFFALTKEIEGNRCCCCCRRHRCVSTRKLHYVIVDRNATPWIYWLQSRSHNNNNNSNNNTSKEMRSIYIAEVCVHLYLVFFFFMHNPYTILCVCVCAGTSLLFNRDIQKSINLSTKIIANLPTIYVYS